MIPPILDEFKTTFDRLLVQSVSLGYLVDSKAERIEARDRNP
jgi:hypothetical protein